MHYGVTCPYGLNICSVIDETITDIFHPYVRASSPSHRVGLVGLFPLPQRQGVSAAKKKKSLYWGDGIYIGPTGTS